MKKVLVGLIGLSLCASVAFAVTEKDDVTFEGTVTNKGKVIVPTEVVTAANVLTAAECGKTMFLGAGTAFQTTLPAISTVDAGCYFKFVVKTASTGGNHTIITGNSLENVLAGGINELEVDTNDDGPSTVAGDTITFTDTPTPLKGDYVEMISDGSFFYLNGVSSVDGAITPSAAD